MHLKNKYEYNNIILNYIIVSKIICLNYNIFYKENVNTINVNDYNYNL